MAGTHVTVVQNGYGTEQEGGANYACAKGITLATRQWQSGT